MSALDVAARGLASRAIEGHRVLASEAGASLVGVPGGGSVEEVLASNLHPRRIDVREFLDGVGQGNETADTDALHLALADACTIVETADGKAKATVLSEIALPPATLLIGDAWRTSSVPVVTQTAIRLVGAGRNATALRLSDDTKWLIEADNAKILSAEFAHFQQRGGAGLFKRSDPTFVGGNSGGGLSFHHLSLYDYSVAAIASHGVDDPLYFAEYCEFAGGPSSKAMLLPPGTGHSVRNCWIHGHKHGIVMRDGGKGSVIDAVRFGGSSSDPDPRTDIWLVPDGTDSGIGLEVINCHHGSENDHPQDRAVLIAAMNGSDYAAADESVSPVSSASAIRQASFVNNSYACNAGQTRGVIFSRSEYVHLLWDGWLYGQYPYVLEYDTAVVPAISTNNRYAHKSEIVLHGDYPVQRNFAAIKASNLAAGVGHVSGLLEQSAGNIGVGMPPAPVAGETVSLLAQTVADLATSGQAVNVALGDPTEDMLGGQEARLVTFTGNNGRTTLDLALSGATAGELCWAEFDLKAAPTESIDELWVCLGVSFANRYKVVRVKVPSAWKRIAIPFKIPDVSGTHRIFFIVPTDAYSAGVATQVMIGRPEVYQAPHRVSPLQQPGWSGDNGDAGATLLVRSSKPTQLWDSPLTEDRTVTLATTGAYPGARFRIVRGASATGSFNLDVGPGPLRTLSEASAWCEVEYDGSAWALVACGSL